jgi:hypothetical protein
VLIRDQCHGDAIDSVLKRRATGGEKETQGNNERAIRSMFEKACLEGIHTIQDGNTIRRGFHQEFAVREALSFRQGSRCVLILTCDR